MTKLRPCPFCGTSNLKVYAMGTQGTWDAIISCNNIDKKGRGCGIDGPAGFARSKTVAKKRAREAWNRRAKPARP